MNIVILKKILPENVHGAAGADGTNYYVLINKNDTAERQEETLIHEMLHIWRGDLDREGNADQLEAIRHEETKNFKSSNNEYLN